MSRSLLVSLSLHILIIGFLLLNPISNKSIPTIQLIEIDTVVTKKNSIRKKIISNNNIKNFKNFFPNTIQLNEKINNFATANNTMNSNVNWKSTDYYTSPSSLLSDYGDMEMSDINFIKNLWTHIDNSIIESKYLAEYGHSGNAFFQFEISKDGELIDYSLKASAEDSILKVIAIRSLRKYFKKSKIKPNKNIIVNAQFAWADYSTCKKITRTHKNFLSFCRYSSSKRKTFTVGEKATTYLGALMYGAGAVDVIKEYNKEENHRENKFDPFEELRRDPDYFLGS